MVSSPNRSLLSGKESVSYSYSCSFESGFYVSDAELGLL